MDTNGKFQKDVGRGMGPDKTKKLIKNWEDASPEVRSAALINMNYEFSGCDMYLNMFQIEGCEGVMMQHGLDDDGVHHFIRFAVDKNGKKLKANSGGKDGEEDSGFNFTWECPPVCPDPPGTGG